MNRRLCLLLVCALAPVAVLSGCGGDATTQTSKRPGVSSATVDAAKRNATSAYHDCLQALKNTGLTPAEKTTLQTECADMKSGDGAGVTAAGRQLCLEEAATLPAPQQATLKATCTPKSK